jgi:carbamoylphosphate synthase large subunit
LEIRLVDIPEAVLWCPQVYIIEANPRASRTVPFVAKAIGHPLAAYASLLMSGKKLADLGFIEVGMDTSKPALSYVLCNCQRQYLALRDQQIVPCCRSPS